MIEIIVKNKIATAHQTEPLVCGNNDYAIQFTFDEEWADYETKTARFVWDKKYEDVIFTGDTCLIPVVDNAVFVYVGVYAGDIRTTTGATLNYKRAITSCDPAHYDPPSDIYNQLLEQMNNLQSKCGYYSDKKKIKDYLYDVSYNELDYSFAYKYLKEHGDVGAVSACSAGRNGNWYGRNFDWPYSSQAEFIVRTPRIGSRYASIGIAGGLKGLTNDVAGSGEYNELYKLLPFMMQDGINECGLVANINALPSEGNKNIAIPTEDNEIEISAVMLVRYILDHFATALSAAEYIQKHATVYFSKALHDMKFELHLMIADENNTYCVEFNDNATQIIDITDKPYITNFRLYGVEFNDDGKVYTNADVDDGILPSEANNLTPHASGLERYNLIVDNYESANTKLGMRNLMDSLKFSRAYITAEDAANPRWYSEYLSGESTTVDSPTEEFDSTLEKFGQLYLDRAREDGATWQTVHSVVYNIESRMFYIIVQEDKEELAYSLDIIPSCPSNNDGTYILKAVVSNGLVTYNWTSLD